MSSSRRHVRVDDADAWIFNRMVDAYAARPPYPSELVDVLERALRRGRRVVDLGAGIGHLALPLAERGCSVTAVEPARRMLDRLERLAAARGVRLEAVHARAEALPLPSASADLVVIADALHFLHVELAGLEVDRVLAPGGAVAIVTSTLDDTPFMRAVTASVEAIADRRARRVSASARQLFGLARVNVEETHELRDASPVSRSRLMTLLDSISFVGPAMNAERRRALWQRLEAIPEEPVWARRFEVRIGRASGRRRPSGRRVSGSLRGGPSPSE